MKKRIVILGSTGSVGKNALQIVRSHPDRFEVAALAADSNVEELRLQIAEFKPQAVVLSNPAAAQELKRVGCSARIVTGPNALREIAVWPGTELVLAASSGSSSLLPVLDAIAARKTIAFANKELLVMAGRIVMEAAARHGVRILPVDSEHNAIFQCLEGERGRSRSAIRKILLTGSGGPLRDVPAERFRGLSKETVIRHPRWNMGKKISVDSATMMNKGLEILEARWLFDIQPDKIEIVIHPEAVIHSMVEFVDGTVLAQAGPTDMKLPLVHCLGYPERVPYPELNLDWTEMGGLNFMRPDTAKFPCLEMALQTARQGDTTLSAALNAADEVAVEAFLSDRIDFADIPLVIERVLSRDRAAEHPTLEVILEADARARDEALRAVSELASAVRLK